MLDTEFQWLCEKVLLESSVDLIGNHLFLAKFHNRWTMLDGSALEDTAFGWVKFKPTTHDRTSNVVDTGWIVPF